MASAPRTLDERDVCRIASAADVDHRTVRDFLLGAGDMRTRARIRIAAAMEQLGLAEHLPAPVKIR